MKIGIKSGIQAVCIAVAFIGSSICTEALAAPVAVKNDMAAA